MNKRAVIGAICAFSTLFALQGSALTFAEGEGTASSTFSIDVSNAVLQLSVPSDANIILNPTSSSGDFGSTNLNIKVSTNNATGYKLSMSVPTTDLTHGTITGNNAPVIPTLTASISESSFPVNAWGYRVVEGSYNPVLTNNTPSSWETDGPTNETVHLMTLAAKVDGTKAAGAYINTLTFQVVANPNVARDIIAFDKNNDAASGSMEQFFVVSGTTENLPANAFIAPSGYRFSGWSTTASGTGAGVKYYGDESPYSAPVSDTNRQVTLYAQWVPSSTPIVESSSFNGVTIARAYEIAYTAMRKGMYEEQHEGQADYALVNSWPPDNETYKNYDVRFAMQDMTPEICASVTVMHDDYEALDVRDNKLYHITKLLDGKCWMTQNLDLDLVSDSDHPYTSLDTNLVEYGVNNYDSSHGYSIDNGVIKWVPSSSTMPESVIDHDDGTIDSWANNHQFNAPVSLDVGDWYWIGTWDNNGTSTYYYSHDTHNFLYKDYDGGAFSSTPYVGNGKHGHIGNYYNWAAAVASNESSVMNDYALEKIDKNAKNSICPAGWRLPIAFTHEWGNNSQNDYYNLLEYYGSSSAMDINITSSPIWMVRGADLQNEGIVYAGAEVQYWTSTPNGWSDSYFFGANRYITQYMKYRYRGTNIRCIAK